MTTPHLITDLMRDEGLRLRAYPDPISPTGHPWTIGYGHTGPEVKPGLVWTHAQARAALEADIAEHVEHLDRHIPWWRTLSPTRQDVLANMVFNLGWKGLSGFRQTLAKVEAGDFDGAARNMGRSLWARQVKGRADRLMRLMREGRRDA